MIFHIIVEERVIEHSVGIAEVIADTEVTFIQHPGADILYAYSVFTHQIPPSAQ